MVDLRGNNYEYPLFLAIYAQKKNVAIGYLLCDFFQYLNLDAKDSNGYTILEWLKYYKDEEGMCSTVYNIVSRKIKERKDNILKEIYHSH